jgi:hypothetical protein
MTVLSTKLKNEINKKANGRDLTFTLKNITINGVKKGCSGFVRNNANGTVVYVNTEESCATWLPRFMFRYADNEKDYKGYSNRWAKTLDELATSICKCLGSSPQEQRDRRI